MSIVNNMLAFCEFHSMEVEHSSNSGKFISQNSVLNDKKENCVEQNFSLANFLNSFASSQVMKTV